MTKGRVVERERTIVKGQGGCWGGGDASFPSTTALFIDSTFLCEIKKVKASRDDKGKGDASKKLQRVQKDGCGQQVSTSAGRNVSRDQFPIECVQALPAVCVGVSACVQRGLRTRFDNAQSFHATSIEHAGVVKLGHQTEQCVETADFFRIFPGAPITQYGKSVLHNMGKVGRRFHACTTGAVPIANHIAVGK
jgi:hypothetical protein